MAEFDATRLTSLMMNMAKNINLSQDQSTILFATVTAIKPIAIKITETNLNIPSPFIVCSPFCFENTVNISNHNHTILVDDEEKATSQNGEQTITIWRGLNVGDKVAVIRAQGGQLYYVIGRLM